MSAVTEQALFLTLVEAGSFKGAADQLKVSTSAVSRQLKQTEQTLGVRLLNRTTRSLSLTQAGRVYLDSCRRIEEEKRTTQRMLQNLTAKPVGRLRITATPTFAHAQLLPALADFSQQYPDIQFDLTLSDRHEDLVESDLDLAIRIGDLKDSRLKSRRLLASRLVLCAAPAYLRERGYPQSLEELDRHQIIYSSHLPDIEKRHMNSLPSLELPESHKVLVVNDVLSIYQAAKLGMGITLLPDYLISKDLVNGVLEELFPDQVRPSHEVFALFQGTDFMPHKLRVFIDYLADHFAE